MLVLKHSRTHRSANSLANRAVKHNNDGTVTAVLSAGEISESRTVFGLEPLEAVAVGAVSLLCIHWVIKRAVYGGIRRILDEGLYLVRYSAEGASATSDTLGDVASDVAAAAS